MFWLSSKKNIFLMLLPTVALYIGYIILPILIAVYYSFTDFSGIGTPEFIGFGNYKELISDNLFWIALKNTAIILIVTILVLLPTGFLLSLLLNQKIKGGSVLRALNFAPAVVAPILVGLIWVFILDPEIGFINSLLRNIGLGSLTADWIGGPTLTPYSIGLVQSWQIIGFIATIFLAGLASVPKEIYESSHIDGANKIQQLVFITIPMLNETFKINVILIITFCFKIFEVVLQLTNGGPNHLSEVLVTYMYNTTFLDGEYGYGMAIATVTSLLTILVSGFYLAIATKNTEE